MNKRSIKHFILKSTNLEEELKAVESFLNEETTGEVYDIIINSSNSSSYTGKFFYHIFYEKITLTESPSLSKRKNVEEFQRSTKKPKII